jgi:hypothetical protein
LVGIGSEEIQNSNTDRKFQISIQQKGKIGNINLQKLALFDPLLLRVVADTMDSSSLIYFGWFMP